jgi:hypothetical protein
LFLFSDPSVGFKWQALGEERLGFPLEAERSMLACCVWLEAEAGVAGLFAGKPAPTGELC